MPKVTLPKITIGDQSHENVELDLPDEIGEHVFVLKQTLESEYVPRAHHNTSLASERKKAQGLINPDQVLEDEEFKGRAMKKWGINPDGQSKPTAEQIAAVREDVVAKEVNPLKEQLLQRDERLNQLRSRDLTSRIRATAAELGVDERFLKPAIAGGTPAIVSMMAPAFAYDEDHDVWVVRNTDPKTAETQPFAFSAKPTAEQPYKTVEEYMAEWSSTKENAGFFSPNGRRSAGPGSPPRAGGSPDVVLTREQASDASQYRAAQKQAAEQGGTVRVEGRDR